MRWNEVDQYLNAHAEPNAVIAGTDYGYYLRADLTGVMESTRVSFDWAAEERLLRQAQVSYMIVDPNELPRDARLNAGWAGIWRQLSPASVAVANYLDQSQVRHAERSRLKAAFIARVGARVHEFSNGSVLYRIRLDASPS